VKSFLLIKKNESTLENIDRSFWKLNMSAVLAVEPVFDNVNIDTTSDMSTVASSLVAGKTNFKMLGFFFRN